MKQIFLSRFPQLRMSLPPLSHLSLREKIGQTCQIHGGDLAGIPADKLPEFFGQHPVGSIFLGSEIIGRGGDSAERLKSLIENCQRASRIPLSIAGDLENGAGGAVRGLTAFPNLLALGAVDDPAAAYEYGRLTAAEACRIGFNWTFGPVVDLALNWLNPIVSIRSLGESPERVAQLAGEIIRGCQEHGLSATAKHFPGDGVDFRDQHLCVSVNSLSEEEWDRTFGRVYEACFQNGVHAVMAGHVALPWIERGIGSGRAPLPATTSPKILIDLLRGRMDYEGVVVSDALIMAGFRGRGASRAELLVEAFNAGIDVMLWPGSDYPEIMEKAIEAGQISESRLDESVRRILAMKLRQAPPSARAEDARAAQADPEAARFAQSLAGRSLTLIENRLGLLPLNPERTRRLQIVLATPKEEGARERLAPLLDELALHGLEAELHVNGNCLDLRRKEAAGVRFDALVACFELWTHGLKNTMRPTGPMAECMWTIQGLETVQPIIVSLGSPYLLHDMPWADTCINAYTSGPHTLRALARALVGEIPFAGVSPVSVAPSWHMPEGFRHRPETSSLADREGSRLTALV